MSATPTSPKPVEWTLIACIIGLRSVHEKVMKINCSMKNVSASDAKDFFEVGWEENVFMKHTLCEAWGVFFDYTVCSVDKVLLSCLVPLTVF
jgi:hypothetical protein